AHESHSGIMTGGRPQVKKAGGSAAWRRIRSTQRTPGRPLRPSCENPDRLLAGDGAEPEVIGESVPRIPFKDDLPGVRGPGRGVPGRPAVEAAELAEAAAVGLAEAEAPGPVPGLAP